MQRPFGSRELARTWSRQQLKAASSRLCAVDEASCHRASGWSLRSRLSQRRLESQVESSVSAAEMSCTSEVSATLLPRLAPPAETAALAEMAACLSTPLPPPPPPAALGIPHVTRQMKATW